jgi:hypothetical protein
MNLSWLFSIRVSKVLHCKNVDWTFRMNLIKVKHPNKREGTAEKWNTGVAAKREPRERKFAGSAPTARKQDVKGV